MALKKGVKHFIVFVAVTGGGIYGYHKAVDSGLVKPPGFMAALIPQKAVLPDVKDAKVENVAPAALPQEDALANVKAPLIRFDNWEWNAQNGLILANGGAQTTKGSLMEKHGANVLLQRQDDTSQMIADLVACAKELKSGAKQCSTGANAVVIMGDGSGQFIAAANPQLVKQAGPEYQLRVIGAVGYSRGEDAFLAPPEVKADPQKARGLLVSGVERDGDWDILMKWAADNNIPNNPDDRTYDPNAINWVNSADYNTAAADFVAGKCEERKLVKDGKPTSETKRVCVNATVTWTPGDVTAVEKRGGVVKVVSSKEYRSEMPSVIVGQKAFFDANRQEVQGMLAAIFEGGDQVKAFDQSLRKAAELAAKVYKDQDGPYWYKYYKGTVETDSQGNKVSLGGSTVCNLGDNLILFGLNPGSNDNFRSTYTVFANIATQQYPKLFDKDTGTPIPDVKEVEDKSFILGAEGMMSDSGAAPDVQQFDASKETSTVSKRSYAINFETGKATLTPQGVDELYKLKDSLAITGLFIQVDGYTDNTGNEQKTNLPLSKARALAVKQFLQQKAPGTFPDNRFAVAGHGSQDPVADNSTSQGRAENRRVQITLRGE